MDEKPIPQRCPFCEKLPTVPEEDTFVQCAACLCSGPDRPTIAEAVKDWNRIKLSK